MVKKLQNQNLEDFDFIYDYCSGKRGFVKQNTEDSRFFDVYLEDGDEFRETCWYCDKAGHEVEDKTINPRVICQRLAQDILGINYTDSYNFKVRAAIKEIFKDKTKQKQPDVKEEEYLQFLNRCVVCEKTPRKEDFFVWVTYGENLAQKRMCLNCVEDRIDLIRGLKAGARR